MDNECKAWESNVDATYEGNPIGGCAPDNWGSCGFQRHFPWRNFATGEAQALSLDEFTQIDIETAGAPSTATYSTSGGVAAAANYNLGGLPFLGGICKLFIPVPPAKIVQVQVAGVHKAGNQYAQFPAQVTTTTGGTPTELKGTAYCFAVANVQETRDNTNNINNGNVAGEGRATAPDGRLDLFASLNSLERQAGVAYAVAYGDDLTTQQAPGTDEEGEVKAGSNFDVVAHFADDWCEGHWTAVTNVRWPNAGAWAGYYSLVACVKSGATLPAGMLKNVWNAQGRETAMSISATDYRGTNDDGNSCADKYANFRFNVRQVGTDIELCGPGQLPDGGSKRCTWNWNYIASATFGAGNSADPEGFFDRSEQMNIDSWVRKRRGAQGRTAGTNNVEAVLKKAALTFTFRDQDGTGLLAAAQTLTSDVSNTLMVIAAAGNGFTAKLTCTNAAAATAQRDNFPVCFTGDEIHFNLAYTPSSTTSNRATVSPWFSTVASDFTSEAAP